MPPQWVRAANAAIDTRAAAGGCGGQSPQVSLQFSPTFFLSHNFFFLCFWHLFCAHASAHVEEGVQSPHVTSHFVLASLHALEVHVALHLLNFLVHLLTAHTSRHEKGPAPARARPSMLEEPLDAAEDWQAVKTVLAVDHLVFCELALSEAETTENDS